MTHAGVLDGVADSQLSLPARARAAHHRLSIAVGTSARSMRLLQGPRHRSRACAVECVCCLHTAHLAGLGCDTVPCTMVLRVRLRSSRGRAVERR